MRAPRIKNSPHSYASQIDALIPEAVNTADEIAGDRRPAGQDRAPWAKLWDRVFHATMDRLALERGLRRMAHQCPGFDSACSKAEA